MSKNTELIKKSAMAAAIAGFGAGIVPGAAALDTPAVATIWGNMIVKIAVNEGRSDCSKKIALSVAKGVIAYAVGTKVLVAVFGFIPVASILVAGVNAALNFHYTKELGEATERLLSEGVGVRDLAELAWNLIPRPSLSELHQIWSDIKGNM